MLSINLLKFKDTSSYRYNHMNKNTYSFLKNNLFFPVLRKSLKRKSHWGEFFNLHFMEQMDVVPPMAERWSTMGISISRPSFKWTAGKICSSRSSAFLFQHGNACHLVPSCMKTCFAETRKALPLSHLWSQTDSADLAS